MNFRDVPNLAKFEKFARAQSDNLIILDCYRRVREIIAPVAAYAPGVINVENGAPEIDELKESCAAVEKSTRLLWACACATENVTPPLWDYLPDYFDAIDYFNDLGDLELMAITKLHRIKWEESAEPVSSQVH